MLGLFFLNYLIERDYITNTKSEIETIIKKIQTEKCLELERDFEGDESDFDDLCSDSFKRSRYNKFKLTYDNLNFEGLDEYISHFSQMSDDSEIWEEYWEGITYPVSLDSKDDFIDESELLGLFFLNYLIERNFISNTKFEIEIIIKKIQTEKCLEFERELFEED